jgi:hypothetical protein
VGIGVPSTRAIGFAASEDEMLHLNIERYQELLKGNLRPRARKMFKFLLAQARSDLEVR